MSKSAGIALLLLLAVLLFYIYTKENPTIITLNDSPIKIATYNMQIFGISKAGNPELMPKYVSLIKNYDIFFVQEIRDSSGVAFKELCEMTGYSCAITSRAGSTSMKEQYGIMWNNRSNLVDLIDYNLLNYTDKFERPPAKAIFELKRIKFIGNSTNIELYNVSFYVMHTKPENTPEEIKELEYIVRTDESKYITVLGDLNADCSYYSGTNFADWNSLIETGVDTTIGNNSCTYDRIIVNPQLFLLVNLFGVDMSTNGEMSDHRPVYFYLN